jgi:serine/threonine-protein kinase
MTATSAFIGTLAYAAPEILNGAPATPASDQYALACTTFTLLTGTPPFPATNPGHLISGHLHAPIPRLSERIPTPPAADAVIARAMAKNPTDRYPTCHDFTTDLHRAMSSRGAPTLIPGAVPMPPQHPGAPGTGLTPATPAPPAPTSPRGSSARRTALLVTAAVSVLLLVAAVAGVAVWLSAGDEPSTPPAAASGTGAPAATSAPDASGDWTAVSTSTTVSCGIKGRALLCWGDNDYGAVGDGTTTDRTVPTAVTGISDVSSVSVAFGQARVCAVSKGDLYCWGQDLAGGDMQRIPTRVDGISDVSGVSSGIATCVVRRGEVYCWGNNVYGSAGVGTTSTSVADPTKVAGLENVASITSGVATTCAITRGAELYCWGQNNTGQVGDGTRENRATPVKIPGLRSVTSVSPGTSNTCAVAEGQVYCWGYGPGQYPSGTENEHLRPEPIGLDGARYVANTGTGGCAAVVSGHVSCWRSGGDVAPTPADVAGIDQVTALDGNINVCAISAGRLYCWGLNNAGQLGDGTTTTSIDQPVRVRDPA